MGNFGEIAKACCWQICTHSVLRMYSGQEFGYFFIRRLTLQSPNRQIKDVTSKSKYMYVYDLYSCVCCKHGICYSSQELINI